MSHILLPFLSKRPLDVAHIILNLQPAMLGLFKTEQTHLRGEKNTVSIKARAVSSQAPHDTIIFGDCKEPSALSQLWPEPSQVKICIQIKSVHHDLELIFYSSSVTFCNHSFSPAGGKYKSLALLSLSITGKNDKKREMQA